LIDTDAKNTLLDVLKFICAILIVGSHVLPIFHNDVLNLYYGQWFFRFAVPLFIISSGFYFEKMDTNKRKTYIKRILLLYIVGVVMYLPNILSSYSLSSISDILRICRVLFFGYYHLWYLVALFMALLVSYLMNMFLPIEKHKTKYFVVCVILLFIGIFFDEYYKIFNNDFLTKIAYILNIFGSTRNFIFMTFPIVTIGRLIYIEREKIFEIKPLTYILSTMLFFVLSILELTILDGLHINNITTDLTFFNFIPAIFLFILTFYYHPKCLEGKTTACRKQADVIYLIHVLVIEILNLFLSLQYYLKFFVVCIISWFLSFIVIKICELLKNRKNKLNNSIKT